MNVYKLDGEFYLAAGGKMYKLLEEEKKAVDLDGVLTRELSCEDFSKKHGKKGRKCKKCGEPGHRKDNCPN